MGGSFRSHLQLKKLLQLQGYASNSQCLYNKSFEFWQCESCGQLYWEGTRYHNAVQKKFMNVCKHNEDVISCSFIFFPKRKLSLFHFFLHIELGKMVVANARWKSCYGTAMKQVNALTFLLSRCRWDMSIEIVFE